MPDWSTIIAEGGALMPHTISEPWKRDHLLARPFVETMLAWAGVLAIASLVFTGLYLVIAALE
jgi:hypothetical protein